MNEKAMTINNVIIYDPWSLFDTMTSLHSMVETGLPVMPAQTIIGLSHHQKQKEERAEKILAIEDDDEWEKWEQLIFYSAGELLSDDVQYKIITDYWQALQKLEFVNRTDQGLLFKTLEDFIEYRRSCLWMAKNEVRKKTILHNGQPLQIGLFNSSLRSHVMMERIFNQFFEGVVYMPHQTESATIQTVAGKKAKTHVPLSRGRLEKVFNIA